MDTNAGLFLGGVARQQNTNREIGLRERAIGVQENQLQHQRQTEIRNQVMEAIGNTTDQAVSLVQGAATRDQPGFSNTLGQIRANVEGLARQAEQAGVGITAESVLSTFDNAVLSTQTAGEVAQTEAQASVAGAQTTAQGVASLPPENRAAVEQLLGLDDPKQSQEFFGLLEILEDPNASDLAKQLASDRVNAISQGSQSGFQIVTSPDGSVTVTQGRGLPSRQTLNAARLDEIRAARDIIVRGNEIATSLIESGTALGALGSVRRGTQTFTGVVSDLFGIPAQEIATEFEALLSQLPPESREAFSVGEVDAAEGILTFAVARAIQGDANRLLTGSITAAKNMVKLTGAISDEQVRDRLSFIAQFLASQDVNFQRRFEQGLTGTTETEREPVMPERGDAPEASDLLNRLDELLGGSGG